MAFFNLFNRKKKKKDQPQASVAPQMSVARPKQQSQATFSFSGVPKLGKESAAGRGISYTQSLFGSSQKRNARPTQESSKPQMSVAPQANMSVAKKSGPVGVQQYKSPIGPQPRPQQDQSRSIADKQSDLLSRFYDQQTSVAQQRIAQQQQRQQEEQDRIRQLYGITAENLRSQLPGLQEQFGSFKDTTNAELEDLRKAAAMQKDQAGDYYGEAVRNAAKARNETSAQARGKFAAQGAVDSAGFGSYGQAQENIDSEFNRYVAQVEKEKAGRFTEIDFAVSQAERQATEAIRQEQAKVNDLARQIQMALAQNDIQQAQDLSTAYQQAQNNIQAIQDRITQLQFEGEQQKLMLEQQTQDLLNQQNMFNSLSSQFRTSGTPTTPEDYIFIQNNPEGAKTLMEALQLGGMSGPDTIDAESSLRNEVRNLAKDNDIFAVQSAFQRINAAPETAAGDLALIFSYMKMLDPGSTVREGEFANAQNAAGVPQQIINQYNRVASGQRLNSAQRQDFKSTAKAQYDAAMQSFNQQAQFYEDLARQQGLNPNNILGAYNFQQPTNSSQGNNDIMSLARQFGYEG